MEDNMKLIEELLERLAEYGKTSFELAKHRAIDKTANVVSSFIPIAVVFVFFALFMLFFNLGLAFWLGEILGKIFYGFIVVAAFYGVIAIIVHFFMRKGLKKLVCNFFIKQVLK